jgi:hypothetical protein
MYTHANKCQNDKTNKKQTKKEYRFLDGKITLDYPVGPI